MIDLVSIRQSKGMTQAFVSSSADVSRSHYANIERGYTVPSVSTAKKLGKALDFDWKLFFEESEV